MPTHLRNVVDPRLLSFHLAAGNIRAQTHPNLPYVIYNYTEHCSYSRAWDRTTLACRGLIVDTTTDVVLARPYPKFFNHGQPEAPPVDVHEPAVVTDKADGSLGILYPTPTGYAVATRGSFTSDQALHATEVWNTRYADKFFPDPSWTYMFEIVYPGNRIVLDYGDTDDLIMLGAVRIENGRSLRPESAARRVSFCNTGPGFRWPGPVVEVMPYENLAEALAASPRVNAEGMVVYLPESDVRIKIKQEDYLRLHKIVTNLNARAVWEHMMSDKPIIDMAVGAPDEFRDWILQVYQVLIDAVSQKINEVDREHDKIMAKLPPDWQRRDYAILALQQPSLAGYLFLRLDDRPLTKKILYDLKPPADWTITGHPTQESD